MHFPWGQSLLCSYRNSGALTSDAHFSPPSVAPRWHQTHNSNYLERVATVWGKTSVDFLIPGWRLKSCTSSTSPLSRKWHPHCLSIVYSSQRESLTALTPPSNLRPNTAVMGSNLGTNVALVGVSTSPSSDLCGTLLTATYATNNASTMVWIDVATTFFSAIQCHLETWTPENSGNWLNHSWRFFFKSLGNSLSQPDHSKLVSSFYSFILHVYLY